MMNASIGSRKYEKAPKTGHTKSTNKSSSSCVSWTAFTIAFHAFRDRVSRLLALSGSSRRRSRQLQRAVVAEHHLFPRLLAPPHRRRRIRVVAVRRRIVVVHRDLERRPLRHELRLGQLVAQLPVEVVLRHAQHHFLTAVG